MNKIYMMKGLPGSGKTTRAKEIYSFYNQIKPMKYTSKDKIRSKNPNIKEKEVIKIQNQEIMDAINNNYDIIMDDTNLNPYHERRIKEMIWNKNYILKIEKMKTPLNECIKRDAERKEKTVGRDTIYKMWIKYYKETQKNTLKYTKKLGVIVDVDGTIAIMGNRNPYATNQDVLYDRPNTDIIELVLMYEKQGYEIIFVSGREGKKECYEATKKWIEQNIGKYKLMMRKENDTRKDYIIKKEILQNLQEQGYEIKIAIDDRNQTVQMWRNNEITTLQVEEGNF